MKNNREYYIGLDIGTDSVGYAVTDNRYKLLKFKGEPMWGSHLFDAANQCAERRSFRSARRRLDRRQQRVQLVDEIFAPEVAKVDPHFYIRKQESALWAEDRTYTDEVNLYFNNSDYDEKAYYIDFPTIHHLICALMKENDRKFDIRLINIAVDWLVTHRGHFLSDISTSNVDKVLDFSVIYDEFISWFDINGVDRPWDDIDSDAMGSILKKKGVYNKKTELAELLYAGKIPTKDEYFLDKKELVTFLAGGKVKCNKLFVESEYEDDMSMSISDDMDILLPQLGDDADVVAKLVAMYDWSVLSDILDNSKYISESKLKIYKQHKEDLVALKLFVKKYAPEKYYEIFRKADKELANYTAYSYNVKSVKGNVLPKRKASKDDFYTYLKNTLQFEKMIVEPADQVLLDDMVARIQTGSFLPKQVNYDNRVIPHQLYYAELKIILENASKHYSFLLEKDEGGYSNIDKLLSIFKFKIPYYVGPLRKDNSKYSWIVKKVEGKIYPWNFDDMVDLKESEEAFINRMTNTCTYLPGENVLPKYSLLYSKYMVLNEINNIKVNEVPISVEAKQGIYNDLFCKCNKVSPKNIKEYLISKGLMEKDDTISGIDITVKSSLKAMYLFRNILKKGILTTDDVEEIISRSTYTEDKERFKKWIKEQYTQLNNDDYKYISRLKYKDFGRLSAAFLNGIVAANRDTGETGTIMHFLWESNDNLMQLLSDRYTFMEIIKEKRQEYYSEHSLTLNQQMDELEISNAVKRPVTRTLAVVKDVTSTIGCAPKKIFVEMARGADEKKQRTVTRKDQILDLYKKCKEDTKELEKQLEDMGDTANNQLQSEALFLYYIQLGKCMYSGTPIDLSQLKSTKYNIDHIYPQSLVKDDSILNNKVLVLSELNAEKGDTYPIKQDWRIKMHSYWTMLADNGLITKEKYARLIRHTPFTDSEKMGFINRQLVETRQSMKAVTQLLNTLYPDTEIVYVKARLTSEFKQIFDLPPKCRSINDLHHAKDAYLNVVVGNVYNERFTKKYFNINDKYTLNTKYLFGKNFSRGDNVIWNKDVDLNTVKNTYNKNNIHLTRYAYCRKKGQNGGFFDQNPVKKGMSDIPIKEKYKSFINYSSKYGGYKNTTASFFVIAKYIKGKKEELSFIPVELMHADRFMKDDDFAFEYVKVLLGGEKKKIDKINFPFGKKKIKYKSVIALDNYHVWINGKANNGTRIMLSSAESAIYDSEFVSYIKKIERYCEKKKTNKKFLHDYNYDGLSNDLNLQLYDYIIDKMNSVHFSKLPGNQFILINSGREKFISLDFDDQIKVLVSCIDLLKSGRSGGCDLSMIGAKGKSSGDVYIGANLSSCKYSEVKLVDISPAGLHVKESINLKELL